MGCSSGDSDLTSRRMRPDSELPPDLLGGDNPGIVDVPGKLPELEAHALLGVTPTHGPFEGGQLALIQGYGFSSEVRVWFGDYEVPREQITALRSDRIQVNVPAGTPGTVDLITQNGSDESSRRRLAAAYQYDAFFTRPERGPTSGGTTITLVGSGTSWDLQTEVAIDGVPCEVLAVRGTGLVQELDCRLGPGSEGQKSIAVTNGGITETIAGGFTYEPGAETDGGFSGAALGGELTVRVSAPGGAPIAGAYVIIGADFDVSELGTPGARVAQTNADGVAVLQGDFAAPVDVTLAASCFQPYTFVAMPVDTLSAQLSPVLSPDCIDQGQLSTGGSASAPVVLRGELVWRGAVEFQRAGWINVPAPAREGERRAAYVLQPSGDPEGTFRLPRESSAVTLDSPGTTGYEFEIVTGSGNRTLYAVAGIEDRSVEPASFNAYALGLVRGIYTAPGEIVSDIAIAMDYTLDQGLALELEQPAASERGPDRVEVRAAVQISESGFALLPNLRRELLLPVGSAQRLVGLPPLLGPLEGGRYMVSARAVTGPSGSTPQSIIPLLTATDSSQPIAVSGFLPAPALSVGAASSPSWNRELAASWAAAGRNVDLILYEIRSGGGLINWSVVAPPNAAALRLPDLSQLPAGDLLPGNIQVVVSLAGVDDFDYARLTLRQLRRFAWDAYALDLANARYEP